MPTPRSSAQSVPPPAQEPSKSTPPQPSADPSRAQPTLRRRKNSTPKMKDYDSCWLDMHEVDALNYRVEQLRALANAMYCVAYLEDESSGQNYLYHSKDIAKPFAVETLAPLSLLSQRLCDEVSYYVHALHHRLREKGE